MISNSSIERLLGKENAQSERVDVTTEDKKFWEIFGVEDEHSLELSDKKPFGSAKLFHCSEGSGIFDVVEILEFNQDDLHPSDVMILDGKVEVYLW